VPATARLLAEHFWPGPLTLVLRRGRRVPLEATGGLETVAVRVPDHPVALGLLAAFGGGITAPSANRFGSVSPTTAGHVRAELGDSVDLVLDGGPCQVSRHLSVHPDRTGTDGQMSAPAKGGLATARPLFPNRRTVSGLSSAPRIAPARWPLRAAPGSARSPRARCRTCRCGCSRCRAPQSPRYPPAAPARHPRSP
jgi:L-threonylcarbamoyladenylate synthase